MVLKKMEIKKKVSDGKLLSIVSYIAKKITNMSASVEQTKGKALEYIATIYYFVMHLLIAPNHEPWFDEAVAWQIARCASLKDILTEIPHYEGHPPLWHLILLPFAKTGMPYELSLALVSLVFSGIAVTLIIWKSPFPRIIRLLLPFTYFFFYQYSIISRPYCVMMLTFVLLAITYRNRNTQPVKYILCMMLLCLTSAFGIVISGGLAIAWILEIWNFGNVRKFIKDSIKDKRIYGLAFLLAFALVLIGILMPREDTYATNPLTDHTIRNNFIVRLIYMLFVSISDVMVTNVFSSDNLLKYANLSVSGLIGASVVGIIFLVVIFCYGRVKKTACVFFIPYILFGVFGSIVYLALHHTGIVLLFFIFWLWISMDTQNENNNANIFKTENKKTVHDLLVLSATVIMFMSLVWSLLACTLEVYKNYGIGRNVAKFIDEHDLDNCNMMIGWNVIYYDEEHEVFEMDTNQYANADNVAPYFEKNIFYNFNNGSNDVNYTTHKRPAKEQNEQNIELWKSKGYPELLYNFPPIDTIWEYSELNYANYTPVYYEKAEHIWKNNISHAMVTIHARNDLLEALGLEEIELPNLFDY